MFSKFTSKFICNIMLFILGLSLVFFLCRVVFIIDIGYFGSLFAKSPSGVSGNDVLLALFNGMRYDGRIVGAVSLFYIALYMAFLRVNRRPVILTIFCMILVFIIIAASVGNQAFYKIFGDTYNILLLGLIYDDRQAIFHTALSGEYNVIFRFGVMVAGTMFFGHFFYRLVKLADKAKPWKMSVSVLSLGIMAYLIVVMMSSTINLRGGSIDYLITPAKNDFLRKVTPGALRDLHLVYITYQGLKGDNFEKYSGGVTPREAAKLYFTDVKADNNTAIDLNTLMKRTVTSGTNEKIDHVFVIVAESLSSWHFDDEFATVGLAQGLKEIAISKNGKRMGVFLENAEGTIGAVDVMITGLYSTGFPISDRTGSLDVFNSSCKVFKNLGYENRFFYFGSPSWRKLDRYVLLEGFDKIYSIADMDTANRGVWGVADNIGFDFVIKKTAETADTPSFNMILTTMYHPPYDMPLNDFGVPVDNITALLDKNYPKEDRYHETSSNIVGHAYLADEMLADFIRDVTERFPNSIVILTGDHFDRMHPSKIRELRIKYGVPLIIYGKNVEKSHFIQRAGSQIDIIPTVIELIAPKGFEYFSFGRPLLSLDKNAPIDNESFALGYESVANSRFIADNSDIQYLEGAQKKDGDKVQATKELIRDKMGMAISWWIINKGYLIPPEMERKQP